jgi:hypothetical protein
MPITVALLQATKPVNSMYCITAITSKLQTFLKMYVYQQNFISN